MKSRSTCNNAVQGAEWVKIRAMGWNGMTRAAAKLNSEMEQGKSAMWHAKVGARSGICKQGQRVSQKYRSAKGVGWLESKWQRRKWQWRDRCGGVIAWLGGKCTALCVMLSRRILRRTAPLTQPLPLSPLCLFTPFGSPSLSCATCPLMILSSCHTASQNNTQWHSYRNTTAPFQECCLTQTHKHTVYREHIEV